MSGKISEVEWVPSHGKRDDCQASDEALTSVARSVNDCADTLTTTLSSDLHSTCGIPEYLNAQSAASLKSTHGFGRLWKASLAYHTIHDESFLTGMPLDPDALS